jgi:hypothetical protein
VVWQEWRGESYHFQLGSALFQDGATLTRKTAGSEWCNHNPQLAWFLASQNRVFLWAHNPRAVHIWDSNASQSSCPPTSSRPRNPPTLWLGGTVLAR